MSSKSRPSLGGLRKRLSGKGLKHHEDDGDRSSSSSSVSSAPKSPRRSLSERPKPGPKKGKSSSTSGNVRRSHSVDNIPADDDTSSKDTKKSGRSGRESRPNVFQRLRERSRSRSRSRTRKAEDSPKERKEMLVAVTSCRSDGYYNQKAPGSTSKLPRKAPTNLKLFHELAVGVKDAYAAVGAVPRKPTDEDQKNLSRQEFEARGTLWDFVGNLDFVSMSSL